MHDALARSYPSRLVKAFAQLASQLRLLLGGHRFAPDIPDR